MYELTWALFRVGSCWGPGRLVSPDDRTGWEKFPVLAAAIKHPIHGWTLFDSGYDELLFSPVPAMDPSLVTLGFAG